MKKIRTHSFYLLLLAIPLALYHWRILFLGEIICGGDAISQFVPWREFALRELSQWRFPAWNPFVFCGTPFAANIQTSLFYPWNLLNLVFSVEKTFSLSLVFHHGLACLTMYAFLYRQWGDRGGAVIGALAYGWSGFFITHGFDGHLIHIRAYALLPLALYLQPLGDGGVKRKQTALFAFSLAGMFYAGHTQLPLYVYYLLFFRAVWQGIRSYRKNKNVRSFLVYPSWTLGGLMLAVGLGAFVLAPLAELAQETASRAGGAKYEFAVSDSMPPQHVATLAAPFFFGSPTAETREGQFWETRTGYHEISGYIGILPLLLTLFAFLPSPTDADLERKRFDRSETIFFAIVTVCGLLFALGSYTPFYKILYYGLPGWSYFRVPGRLLLLFIIGSSVLSARGFSLLNRLDFSKILDSRPCKAGAILSALLLIATAIIAASKPAILQWLRDFEINRTVAEYQLWFSNRAAIGKQLPDVLFETRYAWMLKSCAAACGWTFASWMALMLYARIKKNYVWLVPAAVLTVDLLLFAGHFSKTLPAEEWRETYFPNSELVEVLQNRSQGDRILCLDDAIGYPSIDFHPELRPNRLMHYGIRTVRGYDPIILRSYTRYVNRIFNQKPDAPQGGLLFFPTVPSQDVLNAMNVRLIVTTQSLPEPYRNIWRDAQSGLTVYKNPGVKPILFPIDERNGDAVTIADIKPTSIQFETNFEKSNEIVFSQNAYRGWRVNSSNPEVRLSLYQDVFLSIQTPQGKTQGTVELAPFSMQPLSSFTLGGSIGVLFGVSCLILLIDPKILRGGTKQ